MYEGNHTTEESLPSWIEYNSETENKQIQRNFEHIQFGNME